MEKPYVPYGERWKKEVMKFRKAELVDLYRQKLFEINKLREKLMLIEKMARERV